MLSPIAAYLRKGVKGGIHHHPKPIIDVDQAGVEEQMEVCTKKQSSRGVVMRFVGEAMDVCRLQGLHRLGSADQADGTESLQESAPERSLPDPLHHLDSATPSPGCTTRQEANSRQRGYVALGEQFPEPGDIESPDRVLSRPRETHFLECCGRHRPVNAHPAVRILGPVDRDLSRSVLALVKTLPHAPHRNRG